MRIAVMLPSEVQEGVPERKHSPKTEEEMFEDRVRISKLILFLLP